MGEKALMPARLKPRKLLPGLLLLCASGLIHMPVFAMDIVLAFTQVQGRSTSLDGTARSQMIIGHLKRLDVGPVAVLVRTREMTPRTQVRIALYNNAGHLLVNNGHRQHLLTRPDLFRYQADMLAADARLRSFSNYHRHVHFANFENTDALSSRAKLTSFAHAKSFTPIYISVQVQDAYLNQRYQQVVNRNRRVDMSALQAAYVDMIWQGLVQYAPLSLATHGNAPIVLLLEEHDLTAYFLPGLIDRIRDGGGRIVSPQHVFNNPPVYVAPVNIHTPEGYLAALAGLPPPRLLTHYVIGGDNQWTAAYLARRGVLQ